jgi:hypothetical protein
MAVGAKAWGECQRCAFRYLLRELRNDGYIPGLIVCKYCWDGAQEQEKPVSTAEIIGLRRPSPEISKPAGEGTPSPALTISDD